MHYPFRFQPLFRRYLWGGRRLHSVLNKSIGPGDDFAESWEIVDHGSDQSVVTNGPRAGQTLHELVETLGPRLLGDFWERRIRGEDIPPTLRGRFPLLLKFLDARLPLSVQVHPDDRKAAQLEPPDLGKTEAWYVMATGPHSRIYAGLKHGVDRQQMANAINSGATETTLHSFVPQAGDCVFVPAGTVHAIGSALLICEIQQASDTTFRVHDWNRVDATGKSRTLHVAQALDAIDFGRGPVEPKRVSDPLAVEEPLVVCDKFNLSRRLITQPIRVGGDGRMRIIVVVNGSVSLEYEHATETLVLGQCVLLPAAMTACTLHSKSSAVVLEISLPNA